MEARCTNNSFRIDLIALAPEFREDAKLIIENVDKLKSYIKVFSSPPFKSTSGLLRHKDRAVTQFIGNLLRSKNCQKDQMARIIFKLVPRDTPIYDRLTAYENTTGDIELLALVTYTFNIVIIDQIFL